MIDPRALLTFHSVCRAGSISGAARDLNISQPSVSNAIAAMEARLGVRLFERSRSGILLTPEGEALKLRASMLNNLLRDAEAVVGAAQQGIAGPLHVGGTPGALVSLLPEAIAAVEASGLRVQLVVVERPDAALNDMLRNGDIEIAFVTTEVEEAPADIVETTISSDPFSLIVGCHHRGMPDSIALKNSGHLSWVLPEARGAFHRQIDALFISCGMTVPPDVIRCDSLLTTKAIVRTGPRVTILPREVAAAEIDAGVLRAVEITDARLSRNVGIRRLRDRAATPLASLMEELLISKP